VTPLTLAATGTAVRAETFASFEDAQAIAAEWDALVERLHGSLYMTFDWCRVWWRHYGDGRELRLIALRHGEELAGVLPCFVERLGSPLGRARVAKLVGSDSTLAMVDPPIRPDIAAEGFEIALRLLLEADRADIVHIGPFSSAIPQADGLRAATEAVADVARVARRGEPGAHTVFELPEGFDAYLQGLSKNQRSNYRRNVNKLNKAFAFDVDVIAAGPALAPELEAFMDMHQEQWHAVNKLGHFGDWPRSREFTRDLVSALAPADRVRLVRLVADGEVVSYYFSFAFDGTYYWRLPGRLTDEKWDQYALGRVGLLKMMEVAAGEGATAIEAGNGRYEYKDKLNAATIPLATLTLSRRSPLARARARAVLALGDLLDLAYYRAWYLKAAPRLGLRRRPLWRSWIRRRF
jgi:CelD/BcsL family acetyltransferase involved in cellulose biosynthesis